MPKAALKALAVSLLALAVPAGAASDPLAGKSPFRRLFLNAMVTEQSQGLSRVFHELQKHPANPILKRDKPWEGWGPYLYGTVLRDEGKLKMWYQCIGDGSRICYAESADGIRWTKPELGLVDFKGSRANNIVIDGKASIASVIRLPKPDASGNRWALYAFTDKGAGYALSPDGLRWSWQDPGPSGKLFSSSDVLNFFWDTYNSRYAATFKLGARRHRSAGLVTSPDGRDWTKLMEHPVMTADDLDPDETQVYGMPVFPYQGCYIGLPWIYHARFFKYGAYTPDRMNEAQSDSPRTVDVQLAWSWNLVNWTRTPERKPFLALGPDGAWDDSMLFTATAPVVADGKLYFYYGGFDRPHDDYTGIKGEIGLATLRLDGFCSMRAGQEEGWLITRRERFLKPKVVINARVSPEGYVAAELLDRNNRIIPGFERSRCIPFSGDSTSYVLSWSATDFPKKLLDADKKIRFYLKRADLYSYLPLNIEEPESPPKP